jgi:hypothetical protein
MILPEKQNLLWQEEVKGCKWNRNFLALLLHHPVTSQ